MSEPLKILDYKKKIVHKHKKHKEKVNKLYLISFFIIMFFSLLNVGFFNFYYNKLKDSIIIEKKDLNFLNNIIIYTDFEINKFIEESFSTEEITKIYKFYNSYIKDENITYNLIVNALVYKIPLHKFIALCYQESNFKKTAKNRNSNNSIDYGLFQLNSNTYKNLIEKNGIEWILNPENNIRLGAIHLRELYEKYNTWVEALIGYNCGNIYSIPNSTLKFLNNVLEYEKKLDKDFNETFIKFRH